MSLNHSEETHRNLIARVPAQTGREVREWFTEIENGPSFSRFEDKVNWLRSEHETLSRGQAAAIVHEYDLNRAQRSFR